MGDSSTDRVCIFIDNTNLNLTLNRVDSPGGFRLCYNKLAKWLADGRMLQQVRLYYSDFDPAATLPTDEAKKRKERESFYQWLRWQGFWLKWCPLVDRGDGSLREKGLDGSIIMDMERLCGKNAFDTLVLVSGDQDYREMVEQAQSYHGKRAEVAFFKEFAAKGLQYAASRFINLTDAKSELRRTTPL